ncbi:MAG TPA: winged helix-turn-helix domain-containing protein [Chitinophagaceae bacterium]|jgi:DNA-binding transcriptional ArsR family regulator|nr:winged helix-turn-helix domain-containing protein [Chitinophagaceae bacterium]
MINDTEKMEGHFREITSLIGERSRSVMLWNLLDGRAYTATELAICAGISPQSASNHLSKLVKANVLATDNQGRHKYYRFRNDKVAQVMETIASLLPENSAAQKDPVPTSGVRYARTCYDHLAGRTGVLITRAMLQKKVFTDKKDRYDVSPTGIKWFQEIGISVDEVREMKRKFAYPCLDWSERKPHLGGALGAALLNAFLAKDWIRKVKQSREIIITGTGKKELGKLLGPGLFV